MSNETSLRIRGGVDGRRRRRRRRSTRPSEWNSDALQDSCSNRGFTEDLLGHTACLSAPKGASHLRQQIDPQVRPVDRLENGADRRRKNGLESTRKWCRLPGVTYPAFTPGKQARSETEFAPPRSVSGRLATTPRRVTTGGGEIGFTSFRTHPRLSTWEATAASSSERISENREVPHRDWPICRPLTSSEWPVEPVELGGEIPLLEV